MLKNRTLTLLVLLFASLIRADKVAGQGPARPNDMAPHMGLLGFTLEHSTLADVEDKLGITALGGCSTEEGAREEGAPKVVCYISKAPDKTRVFFESGFSGGWSTLTGFKVVSSSLTSDCHLRCAATSSITRGIKTKGGLRLGLTREQLVALLGTPTEVNGSHLIFQRQWERPMTKAELDRERQNYNNDETRPYFDVIDTVDAEIAGSRVAAFEVMRTTTN